MNPDTTILRIDIDAEEIERDITPKVSMVGDAKPALAALIDLLEQQVGGRPSRKAELEDLKKRVNERIKGILPQADFGRAMRNALPENGVVVSEMTQLGYWSNFAMPVYEPNTYITSGYQGTLGYGFPTALGAKVGVPDAPVLSINGDGGFGFALNELATMAQHNIPAVVLVFNDSAYGNVKRIQQVDLGGREIASSLQNPDYVKLAEAFGVVGRRTETADGLQIAIEESIKANEPTLIEIPVGQMPNPWKALGLR
jgi:acetolactate synthase-1/2/3 large subunit